MTIVEGDPNAPFSMATTPRCREGRHSFPRLLYFTLDPFLIMLSVKQVGIKCYFLSLWYNSIWDWTHVSRAIGEHSNREANVRYVWFKVSQYFTNKTCLWCFQGRIYNSLFSGSFFFTLNQKILLIFLITSNFKDTSSYLK